MVVSPPVSATPLYRRLALGGCLLALLGVKVLLIARLGSPTPFWDQWGEATGIYLPYLSHTLTFDHLIAFHNEHRILLTRLALLAMLYVSGTWDPILQMLIGAVVHVATINFLLAAIARPLNSTALMLLLGFALVFFAVPFGWDNTLWGFQIQFYFLILFSVVSLFLLCHAKAWSPAWLLGTVIGAAGYFSVASGALILPAAIVLALAQVALGQRRGLPEVAGIALHAAISAIVIRDVLLFAPHTAGTAASVSQMLASLMISASWPIAARSWTGVLKVIPAVLLYGPLLILAAKMRVQRPGIADRRWFYLALAAWLAVQVFALSFGRTGGTIQSRYSDIFLIGVVLNAAAMLLLLTEDGEPKRKLLTYGAAVWIFAVTLGAGQKAVVNVIDDISARYRNSLTQTANIKGFLATNDFAYLDNKPTFDIPFPFPEQLRDLLREPAVRAILPPQLTGAPDNRKIEPAILSQGPMLIPVGLALFMIAAGAVLLGAARRKSPEPSG
jgi:hypothetical protein